MSSQPTAALEVRNSDNRGLRIEFRWAGDRYAHTIFALQETEKLTLLDSVEGTENVLFPPSPCFTELHEQDDTLFLTGATSACHWSMSVQSAELTHPEESADLAELFSLRYGLNAPDAQSKSVQVLSLEVACRVRSGKVKVGSQYRAGEPTKVIVTPGASFALLPHKSVPPSHPAVIGANVFEISEPTGKRQECRVESTANGILTILPATRIPEEIPATIQWRYGVWA